MTYNLYPALRPLGTEGDETGATLKLGVQETGSDSKAGLWRFAGMLGILKRYEPI